jgi:hypothetical protein
VFYQDDDGALAALPAQWTDVAEADPFVTIARGRAYCRPADLLHLCHLIDEGRQ